MPRAGAEICFLGHGGAADDERHESGIDEQRHRKVRLGIFWMRGVDVDNREYLQKREDEKENRGVVLQVQFLGDQSAKLALARRENPVGEAFHASLHRDRETDLALRTTGDFKIEEASIAEVIEERAIGRQCDAEIEPNPKMESVLIDGCISIGGF